MRLTRLRPAVNGVFPYRAGGKATLWACDFLDTAGRKRRKRGFQTKADAVRFREANHVDPLSYDRLTGAPMSLGEAVRTYVAERLTAGAAPNSYRYLDSWVDVLGGQDAALDRITKR